MGVNKDIVSKILNNRERLFEAYPILKEISKKNNDFIEKNIMFNKLDKGQCLPSIGNGCSGILFVASGIIKLYKINLDGNETNLYNIEKGDLYHEGLSCILKCESLNISAKALEDSEVFILNTNIAKDILLKDIDFLKYMYKDIYLKFGRLLNNKEEIIHEPLEKRLIELLISKNSKVIYTKHSELAFEIDSSRETISRKLKVMEKLGYIKITRGKIIVLKSLEELLNTYVVK